MRALTFLAEFVALWCFVAALWALTIFAHALSGQPGTDCIIQVEC